jgi:hypothetical protein
MRSLNIADATTPPSDLSLRSLVFTLFSLTLSMSALLLFGFLGIRDGHCKATAKKNCDGREVQSFHTIYTTAIHGRYGDTAVPAELCVWTMSSDFFYPDDTVVFIIAKLFAPANDTFLLESLYIGNFPGDPNDSSYIDIVPEVDVGPFIVAVGQVIKAPDVSWSGGLKTFTIVTSDYVCDEQKFSHIL